MGEKLCLQYFQNNTLSSYLYNIFESRGPVLTYAVFLDPRKPG